MAGHLFTLLENGAGDAEHQLSDMTKLTAADRHLLLVEWDTYQSDEVHS